MKSGIRTDQAIAAIACLCAGVKAGVQKTVTQLTTISSTISGSTTTTTGSLTTTKTSTSLLMLPTLCNDKQKLECTNNCGCAISSSSRTRVCFNYRFSCDSCMSDAQCKARSMYLPYCVFDSESSCGASGTLRTVCRGQISPIEADCPKNAPF